MTPPTTPTLGFLHTAPSHVATFDALVLSASGRAVHSVRPELLEEARSGGAPAGLAADLQVALTDLVARGADVVVCTCSTLGPIVEELTAQVGWTEVAVPVLRVDRPMARVAVRMGRRIGVIAALESTLQPTTLLLEEEASRADVASELVAVSVSAAWAAFEAENQDSYLKQIADAARSIATSVDVIVLAQASMAGARALLGDLSVPVLASPELAVEAATEAVPDR